ncbi:histidine phosphatase family protein [Rhizobium sp. P32RR-XVIII]|uniref:histidine phosphatase family protein n=1 Tax=Rhizobium sp. P32RR-XVIII TaxID=2726738 RepID=UPI0014566473|nr:histidine phosphatase family protein [Rhizobium sp. P32RR-XVIII]NLS06371.1 histidine phosphatase family protein [Rhizobium sp. P32RR-XVIII]
MSATFLLVRHAAHDSVGRFLAGRCEGVSLSAAGLEQARRLGERMRGEDLTAIYTSPRDRTRQTAEAIASASAIGPPQITEALDEVNFGSWSGQTFEALDGDPHWRRWNTVRSLVRTPGGETMLDVQRRVLELIETLTSSGHGPRIALVSHADVIKAAVCHVLGLSVDAWPKFDIAPASITVVVAGDWGAKVVTLNEIIS